VTLNISLDTAHPGETAGLQWTLNSPAGGVASFNTAVGPAAAAAQKSLYCANTTCLLAGINSIPLSNGVIATVTLTLSPTATGNLVVQLSNPVEALLDGTGGSITAANGIVSVDAISVAITPTSASVSSAQSLQLSATVAGAKNSSVTWTMSPQLGSLSNSGLYTAPSTIPTAQTIVVTATSVADPTKSASASISLVSAIPVALSPLLASLNPSQAQQFTANVNNTTNQAVTWSLMPAIGTISNGLYTAPANITSPQTVTVTATSVADPTNSGAAEVYLSPPVAVTLNPSTIYLQPWQTIQFAANVNNNPNVAVIWSLNPALGSISNGKYRPPREISKPQSVTVTATSVADPTKSATAIITLVPFQLRTPRKFPPRE